MIFVSFVGGPGGVWGRGGGEGGKWSVSRSRAFAMVSFHGLHKGTCTDLGLWIFFFGRAGFGRGGGVRIQGVLGFKA